MDDSNQNFKNEQYQENNAKRRERGVNVNVNVYQYSRQSQAAGAVGQKLRISKRSFVYLKGAPQPSPLSTNYKRVMSDEN